METKQLIITIITILLILGLYYLTLLPRKKQEKEIKKMQDDLKKGDKVIQADPLPVLQCPSRKTEEE